MVPIQPRSKMTVPGGLTAIVTGAAGQDGYYLVARLLTEGTVVHATVRSGSRTVELEALPGARRLTIHELDVNDAHGFGRLIANVQPDEFYNFAGQSSVSRSFSDPTAAWQSNADAVQSLLEAIRLKSTATRFYQSSSTDMFGSIPGETTIHDEDSQFLPQSPYAAAKAAAHLLCDAYRRAFDLRVACGILSNHESRRRPASFLTRKVVDHGRDYGGGGTRKPAAGRQPRCHA
jgi:GDPmannose 4,6-dehydratase